MSKSSSFSSAPRGVLTLEIRLGMSLPANRSLSDNKELTLFTVRTTRTKKPASQLVNRFEMRMVSDSLL